MTTSITPLGADHEDSSEGYAKCIEAPGFHGLRTLGILGGMSWESTAMYYRLLNQAVAARFGGLHSAPLLLASMDFAEIAALQRAGDWPGAALHLGRAGAGLRSAGAGALLIATNTMHKVADEVAAQSGLPVIHIADAVGAAVRAAGETRVGLLGTRFTMEDDSCVMRRLREQHGLEVIVPDAPDRAAVHHIIFDELCRGIVSEASRRSLLRIVARLGERSAQGAILGCTEIMLSLDKHTQAALPLFDSTALHSQAALEWMFS